MVSEKIFISMKSNFSFSHTHRYTYTHKKRGKVSKRMSLGKMLCMTGCCFPLRIKVRIRSSTNHYYFNISGIFCETVPFQVPQKMEMGWRLWNSGNRNPEDLSVNKISGNDYVSKGALLTPWQKIPASSNKKVSFWTVQTQMKLLCLSKKKKSTETPFQYYSSFKLVVI